MLLPTKVLVSTKLGTYSRANELTFVQNPRVRIVVPTPEANRQNSDEVFRENVTGMPSSSRIRNRTNTLLTTASRFFPRLDPSYRLYLVSCKP